MGSWGQASTSQRLMWEQVLGVCPIPSPFLSRSRVALPLSQGYHSTHLYSICVVYVYVYKSWTSTPLLYVLYIYTYTKAELRHLYSIWAVCIYVWRFVYVCMYVCMYFSMHTWIEDTYITSMHRCMHTRIHIYKCVQDLRFITIHAWHVFWYRGHEVDQGYVH